jgi:MFS family permease
MRPLRAQPGRVPPRPSLVLMVALDLTIVTVALPHIQAALHFSGSNLEWVVNAYAVAFGGLLLLGGRPGDLLGRRRVLIIEVPGCHDRIPAAAATVVSHELSLFLSDGQAGPSAVAARRRRPAGQ